VLAQVQLLCVRNGTGLTAIDALHRGRIHRNFHAVLTLHQLGVTAIPEEARLVVPDDTGFWMEGAAYWL
jgi:hypothetical protein